MRFRAGLLLIAAGLSLMACRQVAPAPTASGVRLFVETHEPGGAEWTLPQSGVKIRCAAEPVATTEDLSAVEVVSLGLGEALLLQLNPHGQDALTAHQANAPGRRLVLVVNDRALGVVRLEHPVTDGRIVLFVEVPDADLAGLAATLRPRVGARFWRKFAR
jgi:hypothetical protein